METSKQALRDSKSRFKNSKNSRNDSINSHRIGRVCTITTITKIIKTKNISQIFSRKVKSTDDHQGSKIITLKWNLLMMLSI